MNLARYNKFIVAIVGFIGTLIANGVIDGSAVQVWNSIISIATAVGVYAVPNDPNPQVTGTHFED